jgi:DNA-binding CsgD family transcriptional regulator
MGHASPLIGRVGECAVLADALGRCRSGCGGVVLISGEAGVGKSRLVDEVLAGWDGDVARSTVVRGGLALAPMRKVASSVAGEGDIQLEILDRLVSAARRRPTVLVLNDVHEADSATVEFLGWADESLQEEALVVFAVYRGDQLPRAHPLRALRAHLRRSNRLVEVAVPPLTVQETAQLVAVLVDGALDQALTQAVFERAEGVPYFVEELVWSMRDATAVAGGAGVADQLPDTVLDAVLTRTAALREEHAQAVDYAAVLGTQVDLSSLAALVPDASVDALLDTGLLVELDEGLGAFRHNLVRDALHRAIPWARRRALHDEVARLLTERGAPHGAVAEHWEAAHQPERARGLWLAAAEAHWEVHAFRDAAAAARRALRHWPPDEDTAGRLRTLERVANCAELYGDHAAAADAWEELATEHAAAGRTREVATARRRIANAAEMLGDLPRVLAQRARAAEGFETVGLLGAAAEERLALAQKLKAAGRLTAALDEAVAAGRVAASAGEEGLTALALTFEGACRAALGDGQRGMQIARSGLERALAGQLIEATAEAYYELGEALEYAADYAAAVDAYESATELCRQHSLSEMAETCFVCTSPVARLMGDWDRVLEICEAVLANDDAQLLSRRVAEEESGLVSALRGHRKARAPLRRAGDFGRANGIFGLQVGATWGLALVAVLDDDAVAAKETVRGLVELCAGTEECHYALPALRWSATHLGTVGEPDVLADLHRVLVIQTVRNASPKVLSTLAHAAAELAFVEGNLEQAELLMARSLDLLSAVTAPYERALATFRWGEVAAAAGRREAAVERLTSAYRTAKRLGAKPLASQCAGALDIMGEQVERRLGRIAARDLEKGGLTRRETEVLTQLALDKTNKEIAAALFLSTRTVDMHVRNLLHKLGCSSRGAAVRLAVERGLLGTEG